MTYTYVRRVPLHGVAFIQEYYFLCCFFDKSQRSLELLAETFMVDTLTPPQKNGSQGVNLSIGKRIFEQTTKSGPSPQGVQVLYHLSELKLVDILHIATLSPQYSVHQYSHIQFIHIHTMVLRSGSIESHGMNQK